METGLGIGDWGLVENVGETMIFYESRIPNPGFSETGVPVDRDRLIPFLEPDYIRSVDFDAGLVTVDWDPDF
jgi:hypothetical protein